MDPHNMALRPYERYVPIARSPASFFHPTWEVATPWHDFGYHNFRSYMESQFRDMERQMEEMFRRFNQLVPIDRGAEQWRVDNPVVTDSDGSRKLKLQFDVRQFKPEEIILKTEKNQLMVHAKHESNSESGKVYREYHRQILLPAGVNPENLRSVLTPEGVLSIEAPMLAIEAPREQPIPIAIEHKKK